MKKTLMLTAWLAAGGACLGQQLGVSLGPAVFRPEGGVALSNAPTPVNGCGLVRFRLSDDLLLQLSGGYGTNSRFYETNSLMMGGRYRTETRISGFPAEIELLASRPLVILSSLRPCIGLGAGIYRYTATAETRTAVTESEIEADIAGFAQYFTAGCDFRLGKRWIVFGRVRKIGFSGLKVKGEDPYENSLGNPAVAEYETSLPADPGSGDWSLAVGVLVDLKPGRSWSISGEKD
ncbi:hypothetical protein JW777_03330 [bacterium]|nr:hypothetical protein [bacterium]